MRLFHPVHMAQFIAIRGFLHKLCESKLNAVMFSVPSNSHLDVYILEIGIDDVFLIFLPIPLKCV